MKLRIRGNSIRLRLTRSEVAQFDEKGLIEETIAFNFAPMQQLIYALEKITVENVSATFENNRLCIFVPQAQAENWANSNQIGIEAEQLLGENKRLRILIEKDFACSEDRPDEDESDTFPNPLQSI